MELFSHHLENKCNQALETGLVSRGNTESCCPLRTQELWSKQNGICGPALDLQEVKEGEQEAAWVSDPQITVTEYSKDL